MIPQERGLEGLSIYFIFYSPFFLNGEYQLRELLGGRP
jgi:hypothetical protein